LRQYNDERRGRDSTTRGERKAGAQADGVSRKGGRRKRERSQRGAVDQTEHDEGETELFDTRGTAGRATDDRDPQKVREPPRKDETEDGGTAVRGHERKRVRSLLHGEEASPGKDLDGVADEQEQPDCDEEAGIAVRERPRGAAELTCCKNGDRNGEHSRADGDGRFAAPRMSCRDHPRPEVAAADQRNAPPLADLTPAEGWSRKSDRLPRLLGEATDTQRTTIRARSLSPASKRIEGRGRTALSLRRLRTR
jgi:hypothetical protein